MRTSRLSIVLVGMLAVAGLPSIAAAAPATYDVQAKDFSFQPPEINIAAGDSVTFTNFDVADHTITADDSSESHVIRQGQSVTIAFPADEVFPYYCKFHGGPGGNGMSGVVNVGDPPDRPAPVTLAANDAVGAAIAWSKQAFPSGGADFALLARDDVFADALASGAAQGALGGPLLLTPTASLSDATKAELARLGVTRVVVLGGENAVSPAVESELRAAGYAVERVAGGSRIETAIALGDRVLPGARSAIVARAYAGATDPTQAFADALGAGALAAATGAPVLLTDTAALAPATKAYLQSHPISTVTVAGGPGAVSEAVVTELEGMGIEVDRAAGTGRAGTAMELASRHPGGAAVALVDGGTPTAWASGFPAAVAGMPVLLTSGSDVPDETTIFLLSSGLELVCAPNVAAPACAKADTVATAPDPFFGAQAVAYMNGGEEVPGPGHTTATGAFLLVGTESTTSLCYSYIDSGLGEPLTAAHIHDGAKGAAGPPVVTLSTTAAPWDENDRLGCTHGLDAALVADILANPQDYYANLHTANFAGGAIRGQLFPQQGMYLADMTGENERPGPGDPVGVGFGVVHFKSATEICTVAFVFGLQSDPTASHIHDGDAGSPGPPVIPLQPPTARDGQSPFACYTVTGTDTMTAAQLVADIKADPNGYFMNVHTSANPGGAIRGQLLDPMDQRNRNSPPPPAAASRSARGWNRG